VKLYIEAEASVNSLTVTSQLVFLKFRNMLFSGFSCFKRGCGNFVIGSFVTVLLTPVILSPKYEQIG
jgi:hypothetical protein